MLFALTDVLTSRLSSHQKSNSLIAKALGMGGRAAFLFLFEMLSSSKYQSLFWKLFINKILLWCTLFFQAENELLCKTITHLLGNWFQLIRMIFWIAHLIQIKIYSWMPNRHCFQWHEIPELENYLEGSILMDLLQKSVNSILFEK